MKEIHVKRDWQNHLVPTDQYSLDEIKSIKQPKGDDGVIIKVSTMRNAKFLQKFIVLVKVLFEIQNFFDDNNFEAFRYWITCKAGYYDLMTMPSGHVVAQAKSISFAKMDQHEFEKLYNAVINAAFREKRVCGHIKNEDLLKEIESKILSFG